MPDEFDMFGNPVQPGRGCKGRPPFQATGKDRNKVKLLLALGWGNERIANAIDISPATLKRHFRAELKVRDEMRDRLDAERFAVVADEAMKGNITAQKELGRMIEKSDQMGAAKRFANSDADAPTKGKTEKPLGKKEQRLLDAVVPDEDWGFLPNMGDKAKH
ncbi:MAG: AraC family transcriptional regulator [Rhodobacteraceae bacterium]|nr:AraC family transcriptional regulator [Paracoccaceae bacterium]